MKLVSLASLVVLLFIGIASAAPHTAILETVPAIAVGSSTAVIGCTVLTISPGSIIENSAGFVRASCPVGYAIDFHHTFSETPTFTNPGWTQVVLIQSGSICSFNFLQGGSLVGANMTTLTPISFSDSATNSSLGAGTGTPFDYCLYYSSPPLTGFSSFSITWA